MFVSVAIVYFIGTVLSIYYVRYERSKITKVTEEIKNIFVDLPDDFDRNFFIKANNKYLVELVLFFFLIVLLIVTNLFFSNLFIKSESSIGENALYGILIFMQFFLLV